MSKRVAGQIAELGGHIEEFASEKARELVMEGSEKIARSPDMEKAAVWMKEAIDRLVSVVDNKTCEQIMTACGHACIAHNKGLANGIRNRRLKYKTEAEFLEAEIKKPLKGIRLEMQGNIMIHYYTPRTYSTPRRCFCGLMNRLPEGIHTSITHCQCSRGFVEKYWEGALGRPVRVELVASTLSGAEECKFVVHI